MRITKCDICLKEIGEMVLHYEMFGMARVDKGDRYIDYKDLHFCEGCWGKLGIQKILKQPEV